MPLIRFKTRDFAEMLAGQRESIDFTYVYPYIWRVRTRLPARFGQRCRVNVRGKMNSCEVEFEDGYKVITSRNYLRRDKTLPRDIFGTSAKVK